MNKAGSVIGVIGLVILGVSLSRLQGQAPAPSSEGALRNGDIIRLAKADMGDALIIAKIGSSKCQFDTSTDALTQLKQSGVSDAVLKAMVEAVISQLSTPTVVRGAADSTLPPTGLPAETASAVNKPADQLTPATPKAETQVPRGQAFVRNYPQLPDRNYYDFKLAKTKAPEKVGDVQIKLTTADPKRNSYTITLIADDKTVEKKDKSINETVPFYLSRACQPYELVVSQINKDMIVGYVSAPKTSACGDNISQMLSNISDMLAALNRKQAEQGLMPENSANKDAVSTLPPTARPTETTSAVNKTASQLTSAPSDVKLQAAIQQLGERSYYEFKLAKTDAPEKVSDVQIRLVSADPTLNRYTIILIADNKTVEKSDKALNERVQFYLSQASQPYELVVNEIRKDMIIGYISAPKVQQSRKSAPQ